MMQPTNENESNEGNPLQNSTPAIESNIENQAEGLANNAAAQADPPLPIRYMKGSDLGLPEGWVVEQRPRTTLKYFGKIDQFFYEPGTHRQFRSLKAVKEHLGMEEKQKKKNPEGVPLGRKSKASQSFKPCSSNMHPNKKQKVAFDFANPPESVTWVLTDVEHEEWCPFIDGKEVPDSEKDLWTETQMSVDDYNCHK